LAEKYFRFCDGSTKKKTGCLGPGEQKAAKLNCFKWNDDWKAYHQTLCGTWTGSICWGPTV